MQTLFWSISNILLQNLIKSYPYNFELYRFKVGSFFETQCRVSVRRVQSEQPIARNQ